MTHITPIELGKSLHCGLFDDTRNIQEAFDYALSIAKATSEPAAVTTAIFVVVNAIANKLIEMGAQDETTTPA